MAMSAAAPASTALVAQTGQGRLEHALEVDLGDVLQALCDGRFGVRESLRGFHGFLVQAVEVAQRVGVLDQGAAGHCQRGEVAALVELAVGLHELGGHDRLLGELLEHEAALLEACVVALLEAGVGVGDGVEQVVAQRAQPVDLLVDGAAVVLGNQAGPGRGVGRGGLAARQRRVHAARECRVLLGELAAHGLTLAMLPLDFFTLRSRPLLLLPPIDPGHPRHGPVPVGALVLDRVLRPEGRRLWHGTLLGSLLLGGLLDLLALLLLLLGDGGHRDLRAARVQCKPEATR
jgi:hypothetical protein